MKRRIVCFGDSNTWGYNAAKISRFPEDVRWTGILSKLLGDGFQIIEEGLCGRTSVVEDPLFEGLNGYNYIYPCLMSHSPLELVIIMLGTNDTKERFSLTSYNIAQGIARIAYKAQNTPSGIGNSLPKVLVIAPPQVGRDYLKTEVVYSMGKDCDTKSEELSIHLKDLLELQDTDFLDTKDIIEMNKIDYMHLDEKGHKDLADLVFKKLKEAILL